MNHYCTSVDKGYLSRVEALHRSMEIHCKPYVLWILALTEETRLLLERLAFLNARVVSMATVETEAIRATKSGRRWDEYVWTVKPSWILWLLENEIEAVTYVDGDGFFFNSPDTMFAEIGDAPLAITPHRLQLGYESYLVNGIYNGGFVHAKQSGLPCLHEWAAQCIEWCYLRYEDGHFVDQKYLNEWPEKWGAHSILHKGVNLAPWNQAQYTYTLRNGSPFVGNDPVVWFHFHGGLATAYPLHPFIKEHIYAVYAKEMSC